MTGFVDGTENPPVDEAPDVALVPEGRPGAGGSFVLVIHFVHDLAAFGVLPLEDQEAVIGRTRVDSVELDDARKPPTAHIARVVVEENGEELEIYRRSTPYGTVGVQGLEFVAFSADPGRFPTMLARMYGLSDDGIIDRLTEFTTAEGAASYFAPSLTALRALAS
jgi:putative iron-dependent peroxidase